MSSLVKGVTSIFSGNAADKTARRVATTQEGIAQQYGDLYGDLGEYYGEFAEPAQDIYSTLRSLITGEDYSAFRESPGYQFNVNEGLRALERAGATPGGTGRYSGATLKALQERGMGLADQEFGGYLDRLGGLFNLAYGAGQQELQAPIQALAQQAPLQIGAQQLKGQGREAKIAGYGAGVGSLAGLATNAYDNYVRGGGGVNPSNIYMAPTSSNLPWLA